MTADDPVRLICHSSTRLARALAELEVELPSEREVRRGLSDLQRTIEFSEGESGVRFLDRRSDGPQAVVDVRTATLPVQIPVAEDRDRGEGRSRSGARSWMHLGFAALAGAMFTLGALVLLFGREGADSGVVPEPEAYASMASRSPTGSATHTAPIKLEELAVEPTGGERVRPVAPVIVESSSVAETSTRPVKKEASKHASGWSDAEERYALGEGDAPPVEAITREFPESSEQPAVGHININSFPIAGVVLDGRPLGGTPVVRVPVKAGEHTVVFVHPELGRKLQRVRVHPGGTVLAAVRFR